MAGFFDFLRRIVPWKPKPAGEGGFLSRLFGGQKPKQAPSNPPTPPQSALLNEDFLLSGTWLHLASSNVQAMRFKWESSTMEVQYKGTDPQGQGYYYIYYDISPAEADAFTRAGSPGRWVWDNLRVRGTVDGFQKPYVRLSGFAGTSRKPTVVGNLPEWAAKKQGGGSIPSGLKPAWMK